MIAATATTATTATTAAVPAAAIQREEQAPLREADQNRLGAEVNPVPVLPLLLEEVKVQLEEEEARKELRLRLEMQEVDMNTTMMTVVVMMDMMDSLAMEKITIMVTTSQSLPQTRTYNANALFLRTSLFRSSQGFPR